MPIFERLQYALYLLIVASAIVGLSLSIAEAIGLLHNFDVMGLLSHPLFIASVYVAGLIVAPTLSERLPRKRDWQ